MHLLTSMLFNNGSNQYGNVIRHVAEQLEC